MAETTTLADVLRGCTPGRPQSVGFMQVIPLLADEDNDDIASPLSVRCSNNNYGNLRLRSTASKPTIVPRDSAFMTKKAAQDHALPKTVIIPPGEEAHVDEAACIQSSQAGTLDEATTELSMLPFPLREPAFKSRHKKDFQKLWNSIGSLNRFMGVGSSGHVDVFLRHFQKQLDEFVAEFEPVPKQVGAIILINGKVAGIERFPGYQQWLDMWPLIIRECYGSLALYVQKSANDRPPVTRTALPPADTPQDLLHVLLETEAKEREDCANVIRSLLAEPINKVDSESQSGFDVATLQSRQFVGQVVMSEGDTLYASMIATATRMAAKGRQQAFSI